MFEGLEHKKDTLFCCKLSRGRVARELYWYPTATLLLPVWSVRLPLRHPCLLTADDRPDGRQEHDDGDEGNGENHQSGSPNQFNTGIFWAVVLAEIM